MVFHRSSRNSHSSRARSRSFQLSSLSNNSQPNFSSSSTPYYYPPSSPPVPRRESVMNHLVQIARRKGMVAIGFKVQLVVHRMNATLSNFNGAELVAIMTGHKKKCVTKSAAYQTAQKEVVWGDILPFSSTLYMAKTGLFQAKLFQIHVYDTRNDQHVASFEFNLAELVPSNKDAGKETINIATSKCQDPRASISLTIISSRVMLQNNRDGGANHEFSGVDESEGSRSNLSVCTLESHTSAASTYRTTSPASMARQKYEHSSSSSVSSKQPQHGSPTETATSSASSTPHSDAKADTLRGVAYPVSGHDTEEYYKLKAKHQGFLDTIQNLETQLRQSEAANVKLERENEVKDLQIQELQAEKKELTEQLQQLQQSGRSRSESQDDGVMQVDFVKYMTLQEENDNLKQEIERLKEKAAAGSSVRASEDEEDGDTIGRKQSSAVSDEEQEEEAEDREDRNSEASSANEYVDAQEPHLLAEISALKHSVEMLRAERDEHATALQTITVTNYELNAQMKQMHQQIDDLRQEIAQKDEELLAAAGKRSVVNDIEGNEDEESEEAEQRRQSQAALQEVNLENQKLVHQLNQLDSVVTKLKDEKTSLADKLLHAEATSEQAKQETASAQGTIDQLQGEMQTLEGKLQKAEYAHERAQQDMTVAEETISELRQQVADISTQLAVTQQELDTLRNEELVSSAAATAAAIAKNQELQDRWDDLRTQNNHLQGRVEALEAQLMDIEASERAKEEELRGQIEALKQETESLRDELEHLRVFKQEAEVELQERTLKLQLVLEQQQQLRADHDQQVGVLTMQNEELVMRADTKTQTLSAEWRRKVETLEQENDYFQRELIDSKMKLAELTQRNDELTVENKKIEKNLIEMKISAAERDLKTKKK